MDPEQKPWWQIAPEVDRPAPSAAGGPPAPSQPNLWEQPLADPGPARPGPPRRQPVPRPASASPDPADGPGATSRARTIITAALVAAAAVAGLIFAFAPQQPQLRSTATTAVSRPGSQLATMPTTPDTKAAPPTTRPAPPTTPKATVPPTTLPSPAAAWANGGGSAMLSALSNESDTFGQDLDSGAYSAARSECQQLIASATIDMKYPPVPLPAAQKLISAALSAYLAGGQACISMLDGNSSAADTMQTQITAGDDSLSQAFIAVENAGS